MSCFTPAALYSQPALPPDPDDPAGPPDPAAVKTAPWLNEHLAEVPVLIFVVGLPGFGSTSFPIAWQLRLAARVPIGKWGLATRPPVNRFTFTETFGRPVDWSVDEPKWTDPGNLNDAHG